MSLLHFTTAINDRIKCNHYGQRCFIHSATFWRQKFKTKIICTSIKHKNKNTTECETGLQITKFQGKYGFKKRSNIW